MTDNEGVQLPRSEILKFLLPGLNALFGMHYAMSEPFELTIREYATRNGNIMFEIRCSWFGSSRHTSKAVAMRRYRWLLEKWEQGETHRFDPSLAKITKAEGEIGDE
jgi:hypothetical protein